MTSLIEIALRRASADTIQTISAAAWLGDMGCFYDDQGYFIDFLVALLISLAACEANDVSLLTDEKIGASLAFKATWNLSDGSEYPSGRILSRAEDGVIFGDGSLVVADQRYGLVKVSAGGTIEQFGDFKSVGYRHDPPQIAAAPNGVHLTPDGLSILSADVFTSHIYRTSVTTGNAEIA